MNPGKRTSVGWSRYSLAFIVSALLVAVAPLVWLASGASLLGRAHQSADLFSAAEKGDLQRVESLLRRGADPNEAGPGGQTSLHAAAYRGHRDVIRLLVESGARTEVRDAYGFTPLQTSYMVGPYAPDATRTLLELGAEMDLMTAAFLGDMERVEQLLATESPDQKSPLLGRTPVHFAAAGGNVGILLRLFEAGANAEAKDKFGATPLHLAAKYCPSEGITTILLHGCSPLAQTERGATPLHWAARSPSESQPHLAKRVAILLKAGGDIEARDNEGFTPLISATTPAGMVVLLRAGADPDARTEAGSTRLMFAAKADDVPAAQILLGAGADADLADMRGSTALHFAAAENGVKVVRLLLACGADVDAQNKQSRTPLHMSASSGATETTQMLLKNGADPTAKDKSGATPLDLALISGHEEVAEVLRVKGLN